jgi:hypothetical protein
MKSNLTIGIVFGIITVLLCVSPYQLIFFAFTYMISLGFTWTSDGSKKQKIKWTIAPVVFGVIYMTMIQGFHHYNLKAKSLKLEFRLEENFRGEIIVFDNVKFGQKEEVINGRKIIYVPKNGMVYYSKDLTNEGYIDNIFTIPKDGKRITLPNLADFMFDDETKENYKHNYTKNTLGVFSGSRNYDDLRYNLQEVFFVTSKNHLDSIDYYMNVHKKLAPLKTNP